MSNKQKVSTTRITWSLATILLAGGSAGAIDFIHATVMAVAGCGSAIRVWKGGAAALFGAQVVHHCMARQRSPVPHDMVQFGAQAV